MAAPAPLASGAATSLSPTFPTFTRTYSRCFKEDTIRREITAWTVRDPVAEWEGLAMMLAPPEAVVPAVPKVPEATEAPEAAPAADVSPPSARSTGVTKFSKASHALTGYPGSPMTGLPSAIARITGLPGFMATP